MSDEELIQLMQDQRDMFANEARRLRAENEKLRAENEDLQGELKFERHNTSELFRVVIEPRGKEIEKLRAALKPFAGILKGNYSHQSDDMPIKAGANQYDLVFVFTLGDLRAAAAAIHEGEKNEN